MKVRITYGPDARFYHHPFADIEMELEVGDTVDLTSLMLEAERRIHRHVKFGAWELKHYTILLPGDDK